MPIQGQKVEANFLNYRVFSIFQWFISFFAYLAALSKFKFVGVFLRLLRQSWVRSVCYYDLRNFWKNRCPFNNSSCEVDCIICLILIFGTWNDELIQEISSKLEFHKNNRWKGLSNAKNMSQFGNKVTKMKMNHYFSSKRGWGRNLMRPL